ncbi:HisA/HisF-related TIM barrel protein [Thalassospira sp.]|uniref:imidazole glycerol phosphate synthase subunit HisF n=1 Tax=Thalassospira sp. TaxID=1912094 RepID=UPI0032EDEBAD
MLKNRLIAVILVKDGLAVQSIGFNRYLPVGNPVITAEYFYRWGADEILLVDISARHHGNGPDFNLIQRIAGQIFVPLGYAGGIRNADDAIRAVHDGADKVAINQHALDRPQLIAETAVVLGQQAVIGAMDIVTDRTGSYTIRDKDGSIAPFSPEEHIEQLQEFGAGELLINSVDRDGRRNGYDLSLLKILAKRANVPVIAMGGAGQPLDIANVLAIGGVSAAAIGNMLHYTEHSLFLIRSMLLESDAQLRQDLPISYNRSCLSERGRLRKYTEDSLKQARFIHPAEEVI